jgi:hypothetical protein
MSSTGTKTRTRHERTSAQVSQRSGVPLRAGRRRRGWLIAAAAVVVVAAGAVGASQLVPSAEPAGDSPTYATFAELAAASEVFVRGEVERSAPTTVEGTTMTAYTVRVDGSTERVGSSVLVLVPAAPSASEATAESEPLQTGTTYVMGLVPMGDDWQPTSRTQAVFEITSGGVQRSSDGSLAVSDTILGKLGL